MKIKVPNICLSLLDVSHLYFLLLMLFSLHWMTWQTEKTHVDNKLPKIKLATQFSPFFVGLSVSPVKRFYFKDAHIKFSSRFFSCLHLIKTHHSAISQVKNLFFIRMNHFLQIPNLHSGNFKASDNRKRSVQTLLCQILYVAYYRKPILLQVFTLVWCCWEKNDLSLCSGCLFLKN